ncbi:M10 family metallopeptidase domain-containing protein [Pedobacter alluvionis]|uniref:Matrixin n=1 Tax=Pedobacter alluvionis TaxID=475253 RepID=A0A497Y261_9SPHI|nr:M10 family metallopeptidase domain-containing protein [Pedobacter alluvionis]RLJ76961.1 matrixin [Pedobacter alluvionis]TFB33787.1 matrixin family metalloprotease [Pedobacter alluvionis]
MKKKSFLLLICAAILLYGSCQKDKTIEKKATENGTGVKIDNGPIIVGETSPRYVVFPGSKWNKSNLTYSFDNGTADIPNNDEFQAIRDAFGLISNVTNLSFTEVSSGGDIRIGWYVGNHGDGAGNAFDGASGVLAHASYYTSNASHVILHFDDDENWSLSPLFGIDLMSVAIHEIGHTLGLDHSNESCATMNAFYSGTKRNLAQDDLNGIRAIYGIKAIINRVSSNCNNSIFSLASLGDATINWTISNPSIASVINNSNTSAEIAYNGTNGRAFLIANISLSCGQLIRDSIDVSYGVVNTENRSVYLNDDCYFPQNRHTIIGAYNTTDFKWYRRVLPNGSFSLQQTGGRTYIINGFATPNTCKDYEIKIEYTNPCSTVTQTYLFSDYICKCGKFDTEK